MREIFVDTAFWIARIYPRDNLHGVARAWADACTNHPLVTTDAVLGELGTFFAEKGQSYERWFLNTSRLWKMIRI